MQVNFRRSERKIPSPLWGEGKGEGKMKRKNIDRCRQLRKNQTDAEKKLWTLLRNRHLGGVKFRRQFPIGNYILDFYCPEYRIGIEVDGGQHYEDKGRQRDELRTGELNKVGVEIIRFNNREILTNINGVCKVIQEMIERKRKKNPHLNPLPRGERR